MVVRQTQATVVSESIRHSPPHTTHARPATAARLRSVAAIHGVRWSGLVRRSGVLARNRARRRSGERFIEVSWWWRGEMAARLLFRLGRLEKRIRHLAVLTVCWLSRKELAQAHVIKSLQPRISTPCVSHRSVFT